MPLLGAQSAKAKSRKRTYPGWMAGEDTERARIARTRDAWRRGRVGVMEGGIGRWHERRQYWRPFIANGCQVVNRTGQGAEAWGRQGQTVAEEGWGQWPGNVVLWRRTGVPTRTARPPAVRARLLGVGHVSENERLNLLPSWHRRPKENGGGGRGVLGGPRIAVSSEFVYLYLAELNELIQAYTGYRRQTQILSLPCITQPDTRVYIFTSPHSVRHHGYEQQAVKPP